MKRSKSEFPMDTLRTCTNATWSDIEHIWQTAWRLGFYRGGAVFMSAISGIDIALWDLKGVQLPFEFISRCFGFQVPVAQGVTCG